MKQWKARIGSHQEQAEFLESVQKRSARQKFGTIALFKKITGLRISTESGILHYEGKSVP